MFSCVHGAHYFAQSLCEKDFRVGIVVKASASQRVEDLGFKSHL